MRFGLSVSLICLPFIAAADGFVLKTMKKVEIDASNFAGGEYEFQRERKRLIIACNTCDDLTMISAELGRSTDGTEGRFRSGETTIEEMEAICQDRDPKCRLKRLDIGGAVGWVSQYKLGSSEGSTAILFQDGDLLTIRSLSDTRDRTSANMDAALRHIAPQILGK